MHYEFMLMEPQPLIRCGMHHVQGENGSMHRFGRLEESTVRRKKQYRINH